MGVRKGPSAGLCVVRVTSLSLEEMLITVTTKLDVASADGRSCHRFTDAAKAAELFSRVHPGVATRTKEVTLSSRTVPVHAAEEGHR